MAEPRTRWQGLPATVRAAVEARIGRVVLAAPIENGLNSVFATRLETADGTRAFAKGVPEGHAAVAQQTVEVLTSPWQPASSPRLITRVQTGGWDVLVLEWVDGRHADLAPGSADLCALAAALQEAQTPPPAGLVPSLAERWTGHLRPGDAELLAGDTLVHTDLHHENILISRAGAHFIDWSMPAIGPAWADVAYLAVRLMEWDHSREAAVAWAARIPAWREADPAAVEVFVRASCWMATAEVGAGAARHVEDLSALLRGTALR